MKITRVTCCLFVLLLSLVAFAFSTSAPRAHAASGTTFVSKFHGLSAQADFDSLSPDGCIDTFVFVDGFQNTFNKQTISGADVFIGQFNNCTGTLLFFASGSTFSPTFQVGGKLASASLSATISVCCDVSGNTFSVSVSMSWTATGALSHEIGSFHFQTKNFIENFHFNDDFRDASASGTVSDGTTNFTPSPSVFAQIASFKSGDVTISRS